jgi:hypothetical protein
MRKEIIYFLVLILLALNVIAASKSDFVEMIENTDYCFDCYTIYKITKADDKPITKLEINYYDKEKKFLEKNTLDQKEKKLTFSFEKYETYSEEVPVYEPCVKEIFDNDDNKSELIFNETGCFVKNDFIEKQRPFYQEISTEDFMTIYNDAKPEKFFYIKVSGKLNLGDAIDNVLSLGDYVYDEYAWWNASGGSRYYDGNYTVHVFTSNGTFIWNGSNSNITLLIVAGGGSDGGGGGGLIYNNSYFITAGNYSVIVGSGGFGGNGMNSSFGNLIAIGGGTGGAPGTVGGSGGAGGPYSAAQSFGGAGIPGQGNSGGGNANYRSSPYPGGGGGGAGSSGGNATSNTMAGNGGAGLTFNITGTNVCYAGGGGGGFYSTTAGTAGTASCGGGAGSNNQAVAPGNGTPNAGGGGGSGYLSSRGGSGIVVIRYLSSSADTILNESAGRESIINAIDESEINSSYSVYYDKQVFERLANGSQYKGIFDLFVVSGNKRWAFNYDQNTSVGFPVFYNITPVFYVWQRYNLTDWNLKVNVKSFIDSTN